MGVNEFLVEMGWPAERLGEYGAVSRDSVSADGFSKVQATLTRDSAAIKASVSVVGLDGSSSLMELNATERSGALSIASSRIGEPPEPVSEQDAIHLFKHMSSGMGAPKFQSIGPIELPKSVPKAR